jgi:hypothetical protein
MNLRHSIASVIVAAGLGLPVVATANFLDDAVNIVTAPVRAPAQLTQDVLRGAPPGQVIQNQVNINAAPQAHIAGQAINAVDRGHKIVAAIPRQIIGNTLGNDWLQGYDILTASERVQFEIGMTSGRFLTNCAQNVNSCNPVQLAAMPVAAAMRDAYRVYVTYSYPLPQWVVAQLAPVVPPQVLGVARWAVGKTPDFTVPGFLNAANSLGGTGHAVTLGNVMIFSEMPNLGQGSGWIWLLHEMFHIEQYERYSGDVLESIDGFATDYVRNSSGMEAEAQNTAVARFNVLLTR